MSKAYEMVIGLETHVELRTKSKVFCACKNAFGAEPNTHVCPVCMGLPGALPVFNAQVLRYAAMAGMALGCHVHHRSRFDRKNYFYPDLPKAYQISQFYRPLCEGGALTIQTGAGEKRVGITRIHIEEDAGKLLHDDQSGTALDMNRCGVPLIEIVSEPDIRSAEEAVAYLRKLRAILTYTGVSDCRMNEGSMRCDVNLSVHRPGEPFGVRTEMKNLNSFRAWSAPSKPSTGGRWRRWKRGRPWCRKPAAMIRRPARPPPCAARKTAPITATFPTPTCRKST